jgi:hypothetical protein
VLPWAIDPEATERLWALSERMIGEQTLVAIGAHQIKPLIFALDANEAHGLNGASQKVVSALSATAYRC